MNKFIISTDSTTDLPNDYIKKHNLSIMSLSYTIDGETYDRDHELDITEFYSKMRNGSMPITSQVNPEKATLVFKQILDSTDSDILHIAFSSGLSGSYNSSRIAAEDLAKEYPDRKIIIIDSLCASLGEGLLVHKAVKMREAGCSIEETAKWVEENKLHLCHMFTVNDLFHLCRGGRVSKATAVVGTIASIKPVLHVDDEGHLVAMGKVHGRKKSLLSMVDEMEKRLENYDGINDCFFISHGDCQEDAEFVAEKVKERFGIEEVIINQVDPTIGAHSGPGTVALFFLGSYR